MILSLILEILMGAFDSVARLSRQIFVTIQRIFLRLIIVTYMEVKIT